MISDFLGYRLPDGSLSDVLHVIQSVVHDLVREFAHFRPVFRIKGFKFFFVFAFHMSILLTNMCIVTVDPDFLSINLEANAAIFFSLIMDGFFMGGAAGRPDGLGG